MDRYERFGNDYDRFRTPETCLDKFLDFYRDLPPTDGWTVSHVGHVDVDLCPSVIECVIINKGGTPVILVLDGVAIRAAFDWAHLYSPLDE